MYASIPGTLVALISLATSTTASPVARSYPPYFDVEHFSFSNTTTAARYQFNVSFPQDVVISPPSGADPTFTIPGFTTPVACTGTYFYSPSETDTVTLINACGYVDGERDSPKVVTSKLDIVKGDLYLIYTYNATTEGLGLFVWNATQTGLQPVAPESEEGFHTRAYGPGAGN